MNSQLYTALSKLLNIVHELREKCLWDKKQTINSLRTLTISEVYELSDSILNGNPKDIQDELGDLLGHILFYTTIAEETKLFSFLSVISTITDKLIRRHPHIYGDIKLDSEEEIRKNWELTKINKEGKKSIFGGIPKALPSLLKAKIITEKYNNIHNHTDNTKIINKLFEDITKIKNNYQSNNNNKNINSTIGNMLFTTIQLATSLKIDADKCLEDANINFIKTLDSETKSKETS